VVRHEWKDRPGEGPCERGRRDSHGKQGPRVGRQSRSTWREVKQTLDHAKGKFEEFMDKAADKGKEAVDKVKDAK
jgi:hypothetical protein